MNRVARYAMRSASLFRGTAAAFAGRADRAARLTQRGIGLVAREMAGSRQGCPGLSSVAMMDTGGDGSVPAVEVSPRDELADPLDPWARGLALVLGVGATGFGCYAVLASENQAGTAFVLLTGAVLLLLGLQGTPLRRLGSGEHSLELAALRRRRRAIEVISQVAREEPPEVAAAIVEAIGAIENTDPFAADPRLREVMYERAVAQAIERAGGKVKVVGQRGRPIPGYDFLVDFPGGGIVKVEVKYRVSGTLKMYDIIASNRRVEGETSRGGFLLVTNASLPPEVERYNSETSGDPNSFEAISWIDGQDDPALSRALLRKAPLVPNRS